MLLSLLVTLSQAATVLRPAARIEPNVGQFEAGTRYFASGGGFQASFGASHVTFVMGDKKEQGRFSLAWPACKHGNRIVPESRLASHSNYFLGGQTTYTNIPNYAALRYGDAFPGVDLVFHARGPQMEFDFDVLPGASPDEIVLKLSGGTAATMPNGSLRITTDAGPVVIAAPVAYQESAGGRTAVTATYVLGKDTIGIQAGNYDASRPLIIDPVVVDFQYSISTTTIVSGIGRDSAGNVYVAGNALATFAASGTGTNFASPGNSGTGGFVMKLTPDGSTVIYASLIGTANPRSLAVDASGNAYLTGLATSDGGGFPTTGNAFQTTTVIGCHGMGFCSDAFLTKLDPTGSQLLYSSLFGGSFIDGGNSIAVDNAGHAWIGGYTGSADFPSSPDPLQSNPPADTYAPSSGAWEYEGFIAKFDTTASGATSRVYATTFGGVVTEVNGVAVDATGNLFLVGSTNSTALETANPFRASCDGCPDFYNVFTAKVAPAGDSLVYSGYIGRGYGMAIALDSANAPVLTGVTQSTNFAILNAADSNPASVFITKLNGTGNALQWSTYWGTPNGGGDGATAIAVDQNDAVYVGGGTGSHNFPLLDPAFGYPGTASDSRCYAFVSQFKSDGTPVYSTYLPTQQVVNALITDSNSRVFTGIGDAYRLDYGQFSPPYCYPSPQFGSVFALSYQPTTTNPAPAITSLSPTSVTASDPAYTIDLPLTVNGTGFVYGSTVQWNGSARSTQFVSANKLVGAILKSDFANPGTAQITVSSPSPGGGTSNAVTFTINAQNPAPAISFISPTSAVAGSGAFSLTVNGTGFIQSSLARWNSGDRTTTYVSPTQLSVAIPVSDVANVGSSQVQVFNPTPGGGTSNAVSFTITAAGAPVPIITSISPSTIPVGSTNVTLTISGSNFTPSSTVMWNSTALPTTFVSSTQLQATPSNSDLTNVSTVQLSISNGAASVSSPVNLAVQDFTLSTPTSPAPVKAGSSAVVTFTVAPGASGFGNPITFSCSGLPALSTCQFSPATLTPTASTIVTTTITSTAPSSTQVRASSLPPLGLLLLSVLVLVPFAPHKRLDRMLPLLLVAFLAATSCLSACSGSSAHSAPPQNPGTPAGTYTVTINATSGTLQHEATVTLVVN